MPDASFRPARAIAINALISLQVLRHPQVHKLLATAGDSFWRIDVVALKVKSHGAVHLHHRRRGFFARQGSGIGGTGCAVAGARLQGAAAQARSLSQSRSRNDVAVSAWRS